MEKNSNLVGKEFDNETVYDDTNRYIKTKIKLYNDNISINFQGKNIPKENESYKCLSLILLESIIRMNKKHYPHTLLEECKYEINKKKIENYINDDFDLSSSNESDNESDNEKSND